MKAPDFIKNLTLLPLIKGQVTLNTTKKDFIDKLKKVTDPDFDLGRSFNTSGDKYTHEYQCEINGSNFKLRQIQKSGYKISLFSGTIVYGKLVETNGKLAFNYFIVYNIFTNLMIVSCTLLFLYSIISSLISLQFDYSVLVIFSLFYAIFVMTFTSTAEDDISFVQGLINFNSP
jgi:hypothetical protein